MGKIFGIPFKNKILRFILFIGTIFLVVVVGLRFFNLKNFISDMVVSFNKKNNEISNIDIEKSKIVSCTRTTRLDNKPIYDRTLSLIEERYNSWETWEKSGSGSAPWYFFPSQLTNCIKIIEGDVRSTTEAEGYFIFNDTEIKDNYFPITVDKDYSNVDEIINSLLLVHEITHVRQYLDTLSGKNDLTCIDKEVEAFNAEYNFFRAALWRSDENAKSISLRLQYDEKLQPQLRVMKTISDSFLNGGVIKSISEICEGKSNTSKCLADYEIDKIKQIVSKDESYRKQCDLQ